MSHKKLSPTVSDDWNDDRYIFQSLRNSAELYDEEERDRARKAFYAQCTHIDYQIRLLIGTLRECNLLDDTIIVFLSDHGDMLFDHNLVAKRLMYENAARVPLILSGKPIMEYRNKGYEEKLGAMADLMPTLLSLCNLEIPSTVEGIPLFSEKKHDYIYGEVSEGEKSTRMVRDEKMEANLLSMW